jgi:hypothetical protein
VYVKNVIFKQFKQWFSASVETVFGMNEQGKSGTDCNNFCVPWNINTTGTGIKWWLYKERLNITAVEENNDQVVLINVEEI